MGINCGWVYFNREMFQIDKVSISLNIYDGPDDQSMKIGEVYGNSKNNLLKSISSSGKTLIVDFKKLEQLDNEKTVLEASIKYNKINSVCQTWLDINKNILMTRDYSCNINCSWHITSNFRSYIILNFNFIEVTIET